MCTVANSLIFQSRTLCVLLLKKPLAYAEIWQSPSFPCVFYYLRQGWTINWFPLMKIMVKSLSGIPQKQSLAVPQGHNGQSHPRRSFGQNILQSFSPGRTAGIELLESWMWLKGHKGNCLTSRAPGEIQNPDTEMHNGSH